MQTKNAANRNFPASKVGGVLLEGRRTGSGVWVRFRQADVTLHEQKPAARRQDVGVTQVHSLPLHLSSSPVCILSLLVLTTPL